MKPTHPCRRAISTANPKTADPKPGSLPCPESAPSDSAYPSAQKSMPPGFRLWGFWEKGLGFRVQGQGFKAWDLRCANLDNFLIGNTLEYLPRPSVRTKNKQQLMGPIRFSHTRNEAISNNNPVPGPPPVLGPALSQSSPLL